MARELSEEAKAARRAYLKNWEHTHKEQRKEINARYWENRARREAEAAKAAEQSNKAE